MTTEPRLCTDCACLHSPNVYGPPVGVQCAHSNNLGPVNLVNGGRSFKHSPDMLRNSELHCGPNAVWFVPKGSKPPPTIPNLREEPSEPKRRYWWQTIIGG